MRAIAELLGRERYRMSRAAGVQDRKVSGQSVEKTDFLGVLGELAVARFLNVCPDWSIRPRSGGVDLVFRGRAFDVKSTDRVDGRLIATTRVNADVEAYALVVVVGDEARLPGWVWKRELIAPGRLVDLGRGPVYALPQDALRSWPRGV
jgi:hypothetical protein